MADDWRITGQQQTIELGPDRRFHDVLEVSYVTTADNVAGTITVPLEQATPDRIAEMIQKRADLHKSISTL